MSKLLLPVREDSGYPSLKTVRHFVDRKEKKPFKIGIVGPDETKWKPEQIPVLKEVIRGILQGYEVQPHLKGDSRVAQYWIYSDNPAIVVVSGHCPVGEEMPYCVTCGQWLASKQGVKWHEDLGHKIIYVHRKGGVDTIAEIVATELGIKREIHPAFCILNETKGHSIESCRDFYRTYPDYKYHKNHFWLYHFKPRNMDIAKAIPLPPNGVLYDIESKGSCKHCGGQGTVLLVKSGSYLDKTCKWCRGTGVYSGGTWTMRRAKELGKEVYQIVIS